MLPVPQAEYQALHPPRGIHHGGTWHGSIPRRRDGLRITLAQNWMRSYMKQIHQWDDAPADLLERYPELRHILGLDSYFPYGENPNPDGKFILTSIEPYA